MNARLALSLLPLMSCSLMAQEKPNIIFVLVDDMGWGDMEFYQRQYSPSTPRISTPTLNTMAKRGVQLSRHYTAAPVSAPARASLYTGVHQGQELVVRNNNFDAPIADTDTLAGILRQAGYRTALIGKWGIGGGRENGGTPTTSPAWPSKRGFDYFYGYHNHLTAHRHYPVEEPSADPDTKTNAVWDQENIVTPQLAGCYSTDLFIARAKKWIIDERKNNPEQPFFIALTLPAPHARLSLPAVPYPRGGGLRGGVQWLGKDGKMINTASPSTWDSYIEPEYAKQKDWPDYAKRHATIITRIDHGMGDLIKLLQDLKINKNTYIIFTSDNGPHNEAGGVPNTMGADHPNRAQNPSFFRSYGITDGIKRDVWEGGLRVPCLIYAPAQAARGLVNSHPTQFHDWLATCADIADVPAPASSTGRSLLPLIQGKAKQLPDNFVYTEYAFPSKMQQYKHFADNKKNRQRGEQQAFYFRDKKGNMLKAIRTGIQYGGVGEPFEVYDTLADPQETKNLADKLGDDLQQQLQSLYLRNRFAFNYKADPKNGKRAGCTGKRVYDKFPIPALEVKAELEAGLTMRRLTEHPLSWVPRFDTISGAKKAKAQPVEQLSTLELPADSVTELRGYIRIPAQGSYKLSVKGNDATKAFIKLHGINATHATTLQLAQGLHPITITLVQGKKPAYGVRLHWRDGKQGLVADSALAQTAGSNKRD